MLFGRVLRIPDIACAMLLLAFYEPSAAQQRAGYIDSARIVRESEAGQEAERSYAAEFGPKEAELARREQALRQAAGGPLRMTGAAWQKGQRKNLAERNRLLVERLNLQEAETRHRREHLERLEIALRGAVQRLAEQRGLDYVLDDAVYIRAAQDMTVAVLQELHNAAGRY